jgi:hypothetical protein
MGAGMNADLDQALRDYWEAAYEEGQRGSIGDKEGKAQTAWLAIKKRIEDNERWMSQVHVMCSGLGIPPGHIEDRLFEAIDRMRDLIRVKENPPPTKAQIAARLRKLATEMDDIAVDMDYYGGLAEWAQHGREIAGAGKIARGWAEEIEADNVELTGAAHHEIE